MRLAPHLRTAGLTAAAAMLGGFAAACFSEHVPAPKAAIDARAACNDPASAGPNLVIMKNYAFVPATIRVKAGQQVTWVNCETTPSDNAHTVTASSNAWTSPLLVPYAVYSRTFDQPGSVGYYCEVHPFMTATVEVQ